MISGRGLGHTGGTLDKFDSIPGYVTQPDIDTFRRVTREVGCAIIGQTADLAPADKRLYAIRDVTATVESIDLITASILSKKLAAGLQGLVMDVKFGSGAFMDNAEDARKLAREPRARRQWRRPADERASHRHERAAGVRRRQCGRGGLCGRLPHRPPPREALSRGDGGTVGRDAGAREARCDHRGGARKDRARDLLRQGRRDIPAHGGGARRTGRPPGKP